MDTQEQRGLTSAYKKRDFGKSPDIYRDTSFVEKIRDAAGLTTRSNPALVLDLMSGPGKVAGDLKRLSPDHDYVCLDLVASQLKKIPEEVTRKLISGDARALPFGSETFDIIVVRFGLKDLTESDQPKVLSVLQRILKPGGVLVVADMVSPDENSAKEWLNQQHALKQRLGGRNETIEGTCHIPIKTEWLSLLGNAGFLAEVYGESVSHVNTTDWEKSKQVSPDGLKELNTMLVNAPNDIKELLHIRNVPEEGVTIDYPLVVLRAVKN